MDSLKILLSEAIIPDDREFEEIKVSVGLKGIKRQWEFYREYGEFYPAWYLDREHERLREAERRMTDKLVRMTIPLAVDLAKRFYRPGGSQLIELVQVAMIGVAKAAKRYDHAKGRLSTYAWRGAQSSLLYYVRNNASHHPIHLPASQLQNIKVILDSMDRFRQAHGRAPSLGEVKQTVQRLGHDPEDVDALWPWIKAPLSLDTNGPERENGLTLYGKIPSQNAGPGQTGDDSRLGKEVEGLLVGIPPNQAKALQLYYGLLGAQRTYTEEEIGIRFGRTQQWASGILKRGRANLKKQIRMHGGLVGEFIYA